MNTKIEKYITNLCLASKRASVDAKLLSHSQRLKILKKIIYERGALIFSKYLLTFKKPTESCL